ncbi:MAG: glycosyltransferase family 4 protein [Elusimicrobiota bacterium]|nr:glycosyltransferase family 4 protein [Elusimicrobiota bacterium]
MKFKKKKILIILPDNPFNPFGGLGVLLNNLLKFLKREYKINFGIVNFDLSSRFIASDIEINALFTLFDVLDFFVAKKEKFKKYDLIWLFDSSMVSLALFVKKHLDKKVLVSYQLPLVPFAFATGFLNYYVHFMAQLELSMLNYVDYMTFVSKFDSVFYNHPCKFVIPNGIDLDEYKIVFEKYEHLRERGRILYIGRATLQKNLISLINSEIPEGVKLVFVISYQGNDSYVVDELRKFAEANKDKVELKGHLRGLEKMIEFARADAVIYPSIYEPFGITALEGLATKRIVISSRQTGMGEWLSSDACIDCGITPQSISEALVKYVNLNEKEREELINNGYNLAQNYSIEKIAKKYIEMLNLILEN